MLAIAVMVEMKNGPLTWQEVSSPAYSNDEVLVDIYASALNRADLMQRAGAYPAPGGVGPLTGSELPAT